MDRASDFGSEGWGFESLRARQPSGGRGSKRRLRTVSLLRRRRCWRWRPVSRSREGQGARARRRRVRRSPRRRPSAPGDPGRSRCATAASPSCVRTRRAGWCWSGWPARRTSSWLASWTRRPMTLKTRGQPMARGGPAGARGRDLVPRPMAVDTGAGSARRSPKLEIGEGDALVAAARPRTPSPSWAKPCATGSARCARRKPNDKGHLAPRGGPARGARADAGRRARGAAQLRILGRAWKRRRASKSARPGALADARRARERPRSAGAREDRRAARRRRRLHHGAGARERDRRSGPERTAHHRNPGSRCSATSRC